MGSLEGERVAGDIRGAQLVLVGKFLTGTRPLLVQILRAAGARVARQVTVDTAWVIVGVRTWAIRRSGRMPRALLVARLLQMRQPRLQIVSEVEFFRARPELWQDVRLPSWTLEADSVADHGDSQPEAAAADEHEMVTARALAEWRRARLLADWLVAGISPQRIDRALRELSRWIPEARHAWEEFVVRWDGRRLVLRLPNGSLCDQSGQLLLEAATEGPPDGSPATLALRPDDLFAAAVRAESQGALAAAEALYRRSLLDEGPDAHVAFNLANVLVERGQRRGAVERLWQCVELSPGFVEAWYNLGLVALELHELSTARQAFDRTLELAPEFEAARLARAALETLAHTPP